MTPEQVKRIDTLHKQIDNCKDIINYLSDQQDQKEKELEDWERELDQILKSQI